MRGALVCGLALGAGVLLLAGCSGAAPVTDAEARIVASSITSAAALAIESDDDDRLCGVFAVEVGQCENSWANWEKRGSPMPDLESIDLEIEPADGGAQRLVFSGSYDDGETFSSEVLVIGTADGPRAVDPVFWVDR